MKNHFATVILLLAMQAGVSLSAMDIQFVDRQEASANSQEVQEGRYRITGEKALRPEQMSDDGEKTYVIWHPDKALPAVFAVNDSGDEEIVDGYMRAGVFTIDRVYPKLVFRIDRKVARAVRLLR